MNTIKYAVLFCLSFSSFVLQSASTKTVKHEKSAALKKAVIKDVALVPAKKETKTITPSKKKYTDHTKEKKKKPSQIVYEQDAPIAQEKSFFQQEKQEPQPAEKKDEDKAKKDDKEQKKKVDSPADKKGGESGGPPDQPPGGPTPPDTPPGVGESTTLTGPMPSTDVAPEPAEKPEPIELNLDTLAIKEGERLNWRAVREWFEHAEDKIKEMSELLEKTLAARSQFMNTRDEMDDKLEKSFISLGFEQGKLTELVEYLITEIERERQERGDLSAGERGLLGALEGKQLELTQLKKDLNSLLEFDDSLDAVVKRVVEQINQSAAYNQKAHEYFDQIPQGTIKAKEGFYQIDALQKSMQAVHTYISGQLLQYFQNLVQKTQSMLDQVMQRVEAFKKEGVDLQKEADRLEKQDIAVERRRMKEKTAVSVEEEMGEQKIEEESDQMGIFSRAWHRVSSFFFSLYERFFGASEHVAQEVPAESATPAPEKG